MTDEADDDPEAMFQRLRSAVLSRSPADAHVDRLLRIERVVRELWRALDAGASDAGERVDALYRRAVGRQDDTVRDVVVAVAMVAQHSERELGELFSRRSASESDEHPIEPITDDQCWSLLWLYLRRVEALRVESPPSASLVALARQTIQSFRNDIGGDSTVVAKDEVLADLVQQLMGKRLSRERIKQIRTQVERDLETVENARPPR